MDPRDDLSAQAWATLREYQEPTRYLAPFAAVPSAADHPLRAAPATTRRRRGRDLDAEGVRAYLQHSCALVLRGGAGAAVTYPLMACALAEHYVVRRVGGSGAAAAAAAAVAAADLRGPRRGRRGGGSGARGARRRRWRCRRTRPHPAPRPELGGRRSRRGRGRVGGGPRRPHPAHGPARLRRARPRRRLGPPG